MNEHCSGSEGGVRLTRHVRVVLVDLDEGNLLWVFRSLVVFTSSLGKRIPSFFGGVSLY